MAQIEAELSQKRQVLAQTEDKIKRLEEDLRTEKDSETDEKKRKYAEFMEKPEGGTAPNNGTYLPEKLNDVIEILEEAIIMVEGGLGFYRKRRTDINSLLAAAARTSLPFHRFTLEEIETLGVLSLMIDVDIQWGMSAGEWDPDGGSSRDNAFRSMIRKAEQAGSQSPP
ncbi:hypothetical protein NpPPO83_00011511 [Neofusicoccum parvum]|uniref:Uncharacterized protein n=1 Tax=Neofusicoccum parvum TaxID=310453 RepID=A0ACB5S2G8_9PEZI|nr:hypothetical protein NpPPO83_00011511 [Neofusicoccum parvum]